MTTAKSKKAGQIKMLKHDVELSSRLYIVMQHREGDMGTFFKHENHPYPPSLSDRGNLRLGNKSDLLAILVDELAEHSLMLKYLMVLLWSTCCLSPKSLHLMSMPVMCLFLTSLNNCLLQNVLMLYGMLTFPAVSRSQQGRNEAEAKEGRWKAEIRFQEIGLNSYVIQ